MDKKLRLLDLYCGAGGASMGYHRAGFEVTGVDIIQQPHYPFTFVQSDAIEYVKQYGKDYDAIHASPPCQFASKASSQWRRAGKEYPNLIPATRETLREIGKPYIIENVPGSSLIDPLMLNGALFGLRVKRDRLFETSFPFPFVLLLGQEKPGGRPFDARRPGTFYPVGHFSGADAAREAMDIDWMTVNELSQAIPPAYTECIGRELMRIITCQT